MVFVVLVLGYKRDVEAGGVNRDCCDGKIGVR